jgi:Tfp pilus assembly protein PilP
MKRTYALFIVTLFLVAGLPCLMGQEQAKGQEPAKSQEAENKPKYEPDLTQPSLYTSINRRDPFKDLLGGTQATEKPGPGQGPQLTIDDLYLIAIVKEKGKLLALVSTGTQGFPHKIQAGDKFADGYVLSISESSVTFRKTMDKGIRLPQPRDVVKEISQEEP